MDAKPAATAKPKPAIYALDPTKIEVNDVVLISEAGWLPSAIRGVTQSDFSHAAICTQPGMLLEATLDGVVWRSVFQTYATERQWLRVLRPCQPAPWLPVGRTPASFAEEYFANDYAHWRALTSPIPLIPAAEGAGVFCSEVVATAFRDAGLDLFDGRIPPSKVTPGEVAGSNYFEDVTDQVILTLTEADQPKYDLIIKTHTMTAAREDVVVQRAALKAIRSVLGETLPAAIDSLPDFWSWLYGASGSDTARKADEAMLAALAASGYFKWHEQQAKEDEENLALVQFVTHQVEASIAAKAPMDKQSRQVHGIFRDNQELSITSCNNKQATAAGAKAAADASGLKTLARYAEHRMATAARQMALTEAKERLIDAFDRWAA